MLSMYVHANKLTDGINVFLNVLLVIMCKIFFPVLVVDCSTNPCTAVSVLESNSSDDAVLSIAMVELVSLITQIQWNLKIISDYAEIRITRKKMQCFWSICPGKWFGLRDNSDQAELLSCTSRTRIMISIASTCTGANFDLRWIYTN